MSCRDQSFWESVLASKKAEYLAYDTALTKVLEAGVQEYTLEDGQGRQTAKRYSIDQLRSGKDRALSRISELENRLYGCSITINRSV